VKKYLRYDERHRFAKEVKQKRCGKCRKWKVESDFYKKHRHKDGLAAWCKECANIGAAASAIKHKDNAFKNYYERMLSNGINPANDKHSVARKMVSTMSAMRKTDSKFDEKIL